jgi:hypothetical protein
MFNKLYLKYTMKDETPDVVSYGVKKGSFLTNSNTLLKYALDDKYNKLYCFVPIKTQFYILMWDFDFKIDKYKILNEYIKYYDLIMQYITFYINETINETFENPCIEYIYADKNIGLGVHLYYPKIIVDKNTHSYLFAKVLNKIKINNEYPFEIIKLVFDSCISKANGLRLFYYEYDNNYYKPNKELSTFVFDDEPKNHFKYCLINTNEKNIYPKLKININDVESEIFKINVKEKNNDIKNNIKKFDIEYIKDFTYLDLGEKKQMFKDLTNIIDIKRFDDYNSWIEMIFLFKTYGLYDDVIELSKKSKKYDNDNSLKIINDIWKKKGVSKKLLTIGTLIKNSSDDNFHETVNILEKYNINLKLNIKHTDDILLINNKKNTNFIENAKHISDDAINTIINKINNNECNKLLIQGNTGIGKTTAMKKILKSIKKHNYSILSIITRRSMSSTHLSAFNYTKNNKGELIKDNDFNFCSYLDNMIDNDEEYISSLEHLFIFKQFYDVIILDEIFSLCSYLYSDTLIGRRKECLLHLKNLILNAKLVIGADAQIADICFELLDNKNIFYYKNTFQNKLNIPFNIFVSTHSSDNSNLNHIANIIGVKYCKENKSVIIFSDRKNTTFKLLNLLKQFNHNDDYFRVFNSKCGTLEDINNIDTISKNRCLICSPKIIYGVDCTTQYDEIFCIYSKTNGTNSMTSFEWFQQLSRARFAKSINTFILDNNVHKFYNSYISFEKNKRDENTFINNYIYYTDKLYEKYKISNEISSADNYFKNIHFYKSWYDKIFSNNKLHILKLLATQAGYIINESNFESIKINKIANNVLENIEELIVDLSIKIIKGDTIEDKYKHYIESITEQIKNRKKYVKADEENYIEIISNDKKFINYINKKILYLPKDKFDKKVISINNKDVAEIIKDNRIINQINSLFWIEEKLKIERFKIYDIDTKININEIKKTFIDNIDKFICIYKDNRTIKFVKNRINKIIKKIICVNHLQKFYADILNFIVDNTVKIIKNKKTIKNNTHYYFDFFFI